MKFTQEQLTKAKSAKSVEELLALAKENGVELSEEEAKKYYAEWHREGELSDEELQNVSGGGCQPNIVVDPWVHSCTNYVNIFGDTYYSLRDKGRFDSVTCSSCIYKKDDFDENGKVRFYCNDYS